ncbi:MAG TPA: biotin synthase BioB [Bdellovibrionota bacterium]|jgi:biotin synthase|nr:biotin synthase BioB [Bdellovibrionota bacterium]
MNFNEALTLYRSPLNDLLFRAHSVHREHFDPNQVQLSSLMSVKTGGCPEDCSYCPQSAHYQSGVASSPLAEMEKVLEAAAVAKAEGATRFCMGAAWRRPRAGDLEKVCRMIEGVKALGLETCATLGMLEAPQAEQLKAAGLDYYNHNLDTSESFYEKIITTRTFEDRIQTLGVVADAGINVCCGGILGLGETYEDRVQMIVRLSELSTPPDSVPLNMLIPIAGTPLESAARVDPLDFVRLVALTRIMLPGSWIRLAAGREQMSDEFQALCFFAGANSVFLGETLLTAANPDASTDAALFARLGLNSSALRASDAL